MIQWSWLREVQRPWQPTPFNRALFEGDLTIGDPVVESDWPLNPNKAGKAFLDMIKDEWNSTQVLSNKIPNTIKLFKGIYSGEISRCAFYEIYIGIFKLLDMTKMITLFGIVKFLQRHLQMTNAWRCSHMNLKMIHILIPIFNWLPVAAIQSMVDLLETRLLSLLIELSFTAAFDISFKTTSEVQFTNSRLLLRCLKLKQEKNIGLK